MTKIKKLEKPASLEENADLWTQELLIEYEKNGRVSAKVDKKFWNKYNKDDVKNQLKKESNHKCIYCDTKIGVSDFPHIEHLKPKKRNPELTYEWNNLGWCCEQCNIKKKERELLNPYQEDFEELLEVGGAFLLRPIDESNLKTIEFIEVLKLNERTDLVLKRSQESHKFENELFKGRQMLKNGDLANAKFYFDLMKEKTTIENEYYMFKKKVLRDFKNKFLKKNA